MIVPQPRDKGRGEERVRKTGSQVSYWRGQVRSRGCGEALPPEGPREEGARSGCPAELKQQHSMAQRTAF